MKTSNSARSVLALSVALGVVAFAGLETSASAVAPASSAVSARTGTTVAPRASIATALNATRLGVFSDSAYPGSKLTNFYLQSNSSCPTSSAEQVLAKGDSVNITFASNAEPNYPGLLVAGNATVTAWMNKNISCVKTLTDYATTKANGSAVIASFWHEGRCKWGKGLLTDSAATIGQAQQIAIRAGKTAVPGAVWQEWLCGYDQAWEATQLAQVVNPKPDLITVDPYANHSCTDTLSTISSGDLAWVKKQPAYTGYVGISETGMTTTCSDTQLATFYTGWSSKVAAIESSLGVHMSFVEYFNSDNGSYPHSITQAAHPKAFAAIGASMAGQ